MSTPASRHCLGVGHGSEHFECEYSFVLTNEKPETWETASRNFKQGWSAAATDRSAVASSAAVASLRTSTAGRRTSARAIAMRCRWGTRREAERWCSTATPRKRQWLAWGPPQRTSAMVADGVALAGPILGSGDGCCPPRVCPGCRPLPSTKPNSTKYLR